MKSNVKQKVGMKKHQGKIKLMILQLLKYQRKIK